MRYIEYYIIDKIIRIVYLLFSCLLSLGIQAGEPKCDSLIHRIRNFSHQYIQEKAYLHFDNVSYYIGENIWYKAYVVNAIPQELTSQSRILYVDLLSQEGYILKRNKHYIENGMTSGCFALPDSMYAGYYEVRAYTAWMLNFGRKPMEYLLSREKIEQKFYRPEMAEKYLCENPSVFSRVFPVYNKVENSDYNTRQMRTRPCINSLKMEPKKPKLILTFYPEGGHLIENQLQRIAYELKNEDGKVVQTLLVCRDNNNRFKRDTLHLDEHGRGSMEITKEMWNKGLSSYQIEGVYKKKIYLFQLPKAERKGIALRVETGNSGIQIEIAARQLEERLEFTIQQSGELLFHDSIQEQKKYKAFIPIGSLRKGVHQLTVFNGDGRIYAQRLFFVYPDSHYKAFLSATLTDSISPYAPLRYEFMLSDAQKQPIPDTPFSISVRSGDLDDNFYSFGNIETNLLLSSELKGFIANPEHYFDASRPNRKREMDLLMMVQGWSRYDWSMMAGVKPFVQFYEKEQYLTVRGKVYKLNTSVRQAKQNSSVLRCQVHYPSAIYEEIQETDNGLFEMKLLPVFGDYPMFLQAYPSRKDIKENFDYTDNDNCITARLPYEKQYYIYKERALPPFPKQLCYYEVHDRELNILNDSIWEELIEEIEVKENKRRVLDLSQPNFRLDISEFCDLINDIGCPYTTLPTTLTIFRDLTDNYTFEPPGSRPWFIRDDILGNGSDYPTKERIVNALLISLLSDAIDRKIQLDFRFTNLKEVAYYTDCVSRERFIHRIPPTGSFYLNFKTHQGKRIPTLVGDKCILYGYTPQVQFYSPDYSKETLHEKPDHRRTLYWNPDIRTDEEGKASISFYNNGICKKLILSAEGITKDGIPFSY